MSVHYVSAGIACLMAVGTACASSIVVDQFGGPLVMHSVDLTGGGLDQTGIISDSELADLHVSLNDWGVETDGFITFLLADTEFGLAFITLIDSNGLVPGMGAPPANWDSSVSMSTTGPDDLEPWINAEADDLTSHTDLGNGLQVFDALFRWASIGESDAFAWMGLDLGDAVSYHFTDLGGPGLDPSTPFQFLSFTGDGVETVAVDDFSSGDQFVFSFIVEEIVPAPGAIALLGLAGLVRRRRRT